MESTSRPSLHCADRDEGPLGPSAVSRLPSLAVSSDESAQLGYMPNRDDFERVTNFIYYFDFSEMMDVCGEVRRGMKCVWQNFNLSVSLVEMV